MKTKVLKLYLAGPMTGYENFNRPAFKAAAALLRSSGYIVCNPAELDSDDHIKQLNSDNYNAADYYKRDLYYLMECDQVLFLPGWQKSKGCLLEFTVARTLKMPVYQLALSQGDELRFYKIKDQVGLL